jgi:Zn-dependent protease
MGLQKSSHWLKPSHKKRGPIIDVTKFFIWAIPVLFAITVHEAAHGWVAYKNGDKTAFMLGRLTLNPIKHIDPLGTVILPMLMFFTGGHIFGWAKPVPVNYNNLNNKRRDMALVALAGPGSNFLMAIGWGLLAKFAIESGVSLAPILYAMGLAGIQINIILMILNLLPIPPLDGSQVVNQLLPYRYHQQYERITPYGMFILIGLAFSGILWHVILPPTLGVIQWLVQTVDIPVR